MYEQECNTYLQPASTRYSTTFTGPVGNSIPGLMTTTTDTLPHTATMAEISRGTSSLSTVLITTTANDGSQVTVTAVLDPTDSLPTTSHPLSSPSASSNRDSALSKGAVAGIAVAATIGGLAFLAVLAWLLYRRHSVTASEPIQAEVARTDATIPQKPELSGIGKDVSIVSGTPRPHSVVHSPAVAELMQRPRPMEAAELAGSEGLLGGVQVAEVPAPSSALVELPELANRYHEG